MSIMADQEAQSLQMKKVASLARWRQFISALAATIGAFSLGTVFAWTLDVDLYPELTAKHYKIILATPFIGGIVSGPVGGILIENFGRKRIMLVASVVLILGWILVGLSDPNTIILTCIGRFLTGLGGGTSLLASIAYISEFSDARRRGFLLCLVQIMILFGDVFVNFLHLNMYTYLQKPIAYLCAIFPVVFICAITFIRETPRFLLSKGRTDKAANNIAWFKGTSLQDYAVKEELEAITNSRDKAKERKPGCCGRVFIRPILRPLALAGHCVMMVQMCGVSIILDERHTLLYKSGFTLNSHLTKLILGFVMIGSTLFTAYFVDRIGRRTLFIASGFIMSLNLIILGTFYYLNKEKIAEAVTSLDYGWIPIASTFLFLIGFSIGVGPLPWVIIGELLAPGSKGYCLAPLVSVWFLNNYFTSSDLDVSKTFGFHWRLWIFGGVCLFGTIQVLCTLPETKKKTLEKIEQFFPSKKSTKTANVSTLSVQSKRPESTTLLTPPSSKYKWENENGRI